MGELATEHEKSAKQGPKTEFLWRNKDYERFTIRKRENECDDFNAHVPSAKRMRTKNLRDNEQIDNVNFFNSNVDQSTFPVPDKDQMFHYSHNAVNGFQNHVTHFQVRTEVSVVAQEYDQTLLKYLPDLNAIENPHYYETNRLLFELYVERTRRSVGHQSSASHQF